MEQVISADKPEWVPVFSDLSMRQFDKLIERIAGRDGEQTGIGRRWSLPRADLLLLVAV